MPNNPLHPEYGFDVPLKDWLDEQKVDMEKFNKLLADAKKALDDAKLAYEQILLKFKEWIDKIGG